MHLTRLGPLGRERPYALVDGGALPLDSLVADIDPTGLGWLDEIQRFVSANADDARPVHDLRTGPPVTGIGKIVCIGVNYLDHAAETAYERPDEPVVFMKAPDTVIGPHDDVLVPRGSTKTDYEVELAVVIGQQAAYLASAEAARDVVAGYTVSNDVSEREFQLERGGTWDKGKNFATFQPLGPVLVTADELDPTDLALELRVNGEVRQQARTADMIFDVFALVAYLSNVMTLYPGDVINTGTPSGVALGHPDPKPWLRPGDVVELSIEGIGSQTQTVGAA